MGSKNKIADWVVDCLPPAEHFYDLFCGGCAVTHAALLRHKYKTYHVNDITNMGYVFQKLVTEEYKPDYRWVSREEFEVNKEKDILMALCWSFGNDGNEYLYGKDIEPIKKACHYAVCFEDYAFADELGIDLHKLDGIGDIQKRYSAYKKLWREKYAVRPDLGGVERITSTSVFSNLNVLTTSDVIMGGDCNQRRLSRCKGGSGFSCVL